MQLKFASSVQSGLLVFSKYLLSGGLLFLLDLATVMALVELFSMSAPAAQPFGRTVGAVSGYFLHKWFTFGIGGRARAPMSRSETVGYLMIFGFTLIVSPGILYLALELASGHLVAAKVLTEVVLVITNFLAMRALFFARRVER